ncbi:MAG: hypothetical protein PVJ67_06590 [Candidatus Pacearchaeota archaeon]|jgi:hypothetical protein
MGIKCPRCNNINTFAIANERMKCNNCSKEWKPSGNLGKKMVPRKNTFGFVVGRKIPNAKSELREDFLGNKKRVKKSKQRKSKFIF